MANEIKDYFILPSSRPIQSISGLGSNVCGLMVNYYDLFGRRLGGDLTQFEKSIAELQGVVESKILSLADPLMEQQLNIFNIARNMEFADVPHITDPITGETIFIAERGAEDVVTVGYNATDNMTIKTFRQAFQDLYYEGNNYGVCQINRPYANLGEAHYDNGESPFNYMNGFISTRWADTPYEETHKEFSSPSSGNTKYYFVIAYFDDGVNEPFINGLYYYGIEKNPNIEWTTIPVRRFVRISRNVLFEEFEPEEPEREIDMSLVEVGLGNLFNTQWIMNYEQVYTLSKKLSNYNWTQIFDFHPLSETLQNIVDIALFPVDFKSNSNYFEWGNDVNTLYFEGKSSLIDTRPSVTFSTPINQLKSVRKPMVVSQRYTVSRKYNDFRDFEPYTKAEIFLPYVGLIPLDLEKYYGSSLWVELGVDNFTGCGTYYLMREDNAGNISVEKIIGLDLSVHITPSADTHAEERIAVMNKAIDSVAQVEASVGGALMGLPLNVQNADQYNAGLDTMYRAGIQGASALGSDLPSGGGVKVGNSGRTVGYSSFFQPQRIVVYFYRKKFNPTTNLVSLEGKPSNASGAVSTFTGFLSVSKCNLVCPRATQREKDLIMQHLTNGIYI